MREIVTEASGTDSIAYLFKDGSVVWVCFGLASVSDGNASAIARELAYRFLNTLNSSSRWEGKIDWAGNVLESPIDLQIFQN